MSDPRSEKLAAFRDWAGAHITGDEKGQAQVFIDRLMQASGHAGSLAPTMKLDPTPTRFIRRRMVYRLA